jgi:DNA mismatch endonuclease, patch repair protein
MALLEFGCNMFHNVSECCDGERFRYRRTPYRPRSGRSLRRVAHHSVAPPPTGWVAIWEGGAGVSLSEIGNPHVGQERKGLWGSTPVAAHKDNLSANTGDQMKPAKKERAPSKERSSLMRSVRTRNTAAELRVRSILDDLSVSYECNVRDLPGTPDIVVSRPRVAIFVHGCFWHGHSRCAKGVTRPKTRADFWNQKIDGNVRRDRVKTRKLRRLGWSVMTLWECRITQREALQKRLGAFISSRSTKRGNDGN